VQRRERAPPGEAAQDLAREVEQDAEGEEGDARPGEVTEQLVHRGERTRRVPGTMPDVTALYVALAGGRPPRARAPRGRPGARTGAAPWSILAVNVAGSLALGALVGAGAGEGARTIAGVGFLGGFTTSPTFALQVVGDLDAGRPGRALVLVAASVVLGVGAAALGYLTTSPPVTGAAPVPEEAAPPPRVGLWEVAREWGRIGVIGFGGAAGARRACCATSSWERRPLLDARARSRTPTQRAGCCPGPRRPSSPSSARSPWLACAARSSAGSRSSSPGCCSSSCCAAAALAMRRRGGSSGWRPGRARSSWRSSCTPASSSAARRWPAWPAPGGLRALAYIAVAAVAAVLAGVLVVVVLLACGLFELAVRRAGTGRAAVHALPRCSCSPRRSCPS
jgi:CrcB protein